MKFVLKEPLTDVPVEYDPEKLYWSDQMVICMVCFTAFKYKGRLAHLNSDKCKKAKAKKMQEEQEEAEKELMAVLEQPDNEETD